jgi:hypothetical protein
MGNLYEYFAADTDDQAAAATQTPAGPVGAGGWDAIHGPGIEPSINLADLEEVLTGVSYEDIVGNPRASKTISGDEHCFVVTVTDRLHGTLAALPPDRIPIVAGEWSHAEEFDGAASPGDLAGFLSEFRALAERAAQRSQRLYCWVSL